MYFVIPASNSVIPAPNFVIPASNSVIPASNSVIPAKGLPPRKRGAGIHGVSERPLKPIPRHSLARGLDSGSPLRSGRNDGGG